MAHAMVMLPAPSMRAFRDSWLPAPSMRAFRDSWLRALRAGLAD